MERLEELNLFIERADDLIGSKYILADIKLASLLKTIAVSETMLALFHNCLTGFDYNAALKKYFVKSQHLAPDKGEFVLPPNSRELLAFVFTVLVDIDAKRIDLNGLLGRYFYVDGSSTASYDAFINAMIKPFKNTVKMLMESIIEGKLQDPIEALVEEEQRRAKEQEEKEVADKKEKELLRKTYGESLKTAKEMLLVDKQKIKNSKLAQDVQNEFLLVVDMLANVLISEDKDSLEYAFIAYKYVAKSKPVLFSGRVKALEKLVKDVINGI